MNVYYCGKTGIACQRDLVMNFYYYGKTGIACQREVVMNFYNYGEALASIAPILQLKKSHEHLNDRSAATTART